MVMSQVRGIIRNVSETLVAIEEVGKVVEAIRGVKMILARHHQLCHLLPRLVQGIVKICTKNWYWYVA